MMSLRKPWHRREQKDWQSVHSAFGCVTRSVAKGRPRGKGVADARGLAMGCDDALCGFYRLSAHRKNTPPASAINDTCISSAG